MLPYEFPWWVSILAGIVVFMLYVGIGILVCSLFTYILTTRDRPDSNGMSSSRRLETCFSEAWREAPCN